MYSLHSINILKHLHTLLARGSFHWALSAMPSESCTHHLSQCLWEHREDCAQSSEASHSTSAVAFGWSGVHGSPVAGCTCPDQAPAQDPSKSVKLEKLIWSTLLKDKIQDNDTKNHLHISTRAIYFVRWPMNGIGGRQHARCRLTSTSSFAISSDWTFHMLHVIVSCPDYFSPFFWRARKMRSGDETIHVRHMMRMRIYVPSKRRSRIRSSLFFLPMFLEFFPALAMLTVLPCQATIKGRDELTYISPHVYS